MGPPNRCLSEHVDTAELATSKQELGRLASSQHALPASTQAKTNKERRRNTLATSVQRIARKVRTHPLRLQVPWKESSQGLAKSKETVSLILWTLCPQILLNLAKAWVDYLNLSLYPRACAAARALALCQSSIMLVSAGWDVMRICAVSVVICESCIILRPNVRKLILIHPFHPLFALIIVKYLSRISTDMNSFAPCVPNDTFAYLCNNTFSASRRQYPVNLVVEACWFSMSKEGCQKHNWAPLTVMFVHGRETCMLPTCAKYSRHCHGIMQPLLQ